MLVLGIMAIVIGLLSYLKGLSIKGRGVFSFIGFVPTAVGIGLMTIGTFLALLGAF